MIIWLASFPRSGNTFARILLKHVYGIQTYSVYNDPNFDELGASDVVGHAPLPAPLATMAKSKEVYLVKTHEMPSDNRPALYLVRDGRDALVSFARYRLAFEMKKEKREALGKRAYLASLRHTLTAPRNGGWSGNVLAWTRDRRKGHTVALRYEDLLAAPVASLRHSLEQLGVFPAPIGGKVPNFKSLQRRWPKFFRKGRVGSWKQEMPPKALELFWQHHGEAMDYFNYPRDAAPKPAKAAP